MVRRSGCAAVRLPIAEQLAPLNPGDGFTKANFLRELEFLTLVSPRDAELLRPIIADDRTSEVIVRKGRMLTLASRSSPRQPTCC
jgi:hypothetical protein